MLSHASAPRAAPFLFSEPATAVRERPLPAAPAAVLRLGSAPRAGLAKPGVLVVDDEPLVRFLIEDTLDAAGFEVADAADAAGALARLDAGDPFCRVLVTDLRLGPGPDGLALAAEARRRRPDLRVLFVTGNPERVPARPDGRPAECVLGKPFRCAELVATVRWLLAPPPRVTEGR